MSHRHFLVFVSRVIRLPRYSDWSLTSTCFESRARAATPFLIDHGPSHETEHVVDLNKALHWRLSQVSYPCPLSCLILIPTLGGHSIYYRTKKCGLVHPKCSRHAASKRVGEEKGGTAVRRSHAWHAWLNVLIGRAAFCNNSHGETHWAPRLVCDACSRREQGFVPLFSVQHEAAHNPSPDSVSRSPITSSQALPFTPPLCLHLCPSTRNMLSFSKCQRRLQLSPPRGRGRRRTDVPLWQSSRE